MNRPAEPENSHTEETYYIVQVALKPQKTFNYARGIRWEWLSIDSGYQSHTSTRSHAYRMRQPPTKEVIHGYSGMPWYCVHDLRFKPRIFRVTERHTVETELIG